jgi:hypothetical protein
MASMMDVNAVKKRVETSLHVTGKPDEPRSIFNEVLMEWGDIYNENLAKKESSEEAAQARNAIASLWIAFSGLEISLRQWKRAVNVYEEALKEPLVVEIPSLYLSYARFCADRNKFGNARKAYIRGLQAIKKQSDVDLLWRNFLATERKASENDALKILELFDALKESAPDLPKPSEPFVEDIDVATVNSPGSSSSNLTEGATGATGVSGKDSLISSLFPGQAQLEGATPATTEAAAAAATQAQDDLAPRDPMELQAEALWQAIALLSAAESPAGLPRPLDMDDPMGTAPLTLIKRFTVRPPMLFVPPGQQLLVALSAQDKLLLEQALGAAGTGDGRQVVTLPLALPSRSEPEGAPTPMDRATVVADMMECLWVVQVLKERHFEHWMSTLYGRHQQEEAKLKTLIASKEATAPVVARDKVKKKCALEVRSFHDRCEVQKALLEAVVNLTFHRILALQQRVLATLEIPGFSLDLARKLEAASVAPFQPYPVVYEPALLAALPRQRSVVSALISNRLETFHIDPAMIARAAGLASGPPGASNGATAAAGAGAGAGAPGVQGGGGGGKKRPRAGDRGGGGGGEGDARSRGTRGRRGGRGNIRGGGELGAGLGLGAGMGVGGMPAGGAGAGAGAGAGGVAGGVIGMGMQQLPPGMGVPAGMNMNMNMNLNMNMNMGMAMPMPPDLATQQRQQQVQQPPPLPPQPPLPPSQLSAEGSGGDLAAKLARLKKLAGK